MKLTGRHTHRLFGRLKVWTVEIESEPVELAGLRMDHDNLGPTDEELALRAREVAALEASVAAHGGRIPVTTTEVLEV